MPEQKTPHEQEETKTEEQANKAGETSQEEEAPKEPEGDLWEGIDEDHPVRQVVRDLRGEAAARRNEKKELQEALSELEQKVEGLKAPEEFQQAIEEANRKAQEAERIALRERVGRTHHLPESLIPRLAGETEEDMIADAKQLQQDLGIDPEGRQRQAPPKPPARGGLTPGNRSQDTESLVKKLRRGNRNF